LRFSGSEREVTAPAYTVRFPPGALGPIQGLLQVTPWAGISIVGAKREATSAKVAVDGMEVRARVGQSGSRLRR
jgi:hypothetical protein